MFNSFCSNLRAELNDLKTLKAEFDREYQQALTTGNMDRVKELRVILEQKRDNLAQKLFEWKWSLFYPRIILSVENKENYWLVEKLESGHGSVLTLQVLPDGRIVSGGEDGTIRIWDGRVTPKTKPAI